MSLTLSVSDIVESSQSALLATHSTWERIQLCEVATVQNGFAFPSSDFTQSEGVPLIRIRDILTAETDARFAGKYEDVYLVTPGELLVGMDGDFNSALWRGPTGLLNQRVCRVTTDEDFYDQRFLSYALPGYLKAINDVTSSVTVKHLSSRSVEQIPLPLPPLAEQRRIVAAIEEQFTRLDAGVAALKRAQAALKRYRAAVLKAAVEGKLTAAWRSQHPDVQPARELLADILAERRARWEADLRAKGKDPAKAKYDEPQSPQTEGLPELPQGWVWAAVEQVGEVQLGRQRAPQHHTGEYMRPYLRVANVFEDRIDVSDVLEMNFTPSEYETYQLKFGDILLNEGQSLELIGRPAMYRDEVPGACFQNTLVRFRAHAGLPASYALVVFLAYLHSQRFQRIGKHTTNIAHLGAGRFAALEFPLPSSAEMERIVAEVEQRLSVVSVLEGTIAANLKRAERLRQVILERAFTGRLVPQDPADEPASALLERTRREREGAGEKQVTSAAQVGLWERSHSL